MDPTFSFSSKSRRKLQISQYFLQLNLTYFFLSNRLKSRKGLDLTYRITRSDTKKLIINLYNNNIKKKIIHGIILLKTYRIA